MLRGLLAAESARQIHYVLMGTFDGADVTRIASIANIASLGESPYGHWGEPGYLIVAAEADVNVRSVPQRNGRLLHFVDEQANPHAVSLHPSGRYGDQALILGVLSINDASPASLSLGRIIEQHLIREFRQVKDCWVGPEAMALFHTGVRLTPGVKWSREADLLVPS